METALPVLIFVVEENDAYGELLAYALRQNPAYTVRRFAALDASLAALAAEKCAPDVVVLDPSPQAATDLRRLRKLCPDALVVVVSDQKDIGTAVDLLRLGAYDYLVKGPDTTARLWQVVGNVARQLHLRRENERLRQALQQHPAAAGPDLLGEHPSLARVRRLIAKAAGTDVTVSVSGETGTGKELVAQAIHRRSARAGQPFVAVNMAAIPRELLESELFGHEKGAFTGATARRVGRLEEAHGGTLFLDEIADLELPLQAKLLRVLQERRATRLGGRQPVAFDVRLVVATHRDLAAEVQAGRFREDLYYRLLGLPIELPPLRARGRDVLLLAEAFARDFNRRNHLPDRGFSDCARRRLLAHPWPGNVRELKAVVELAAVLAEGEHIESADLPLRLPPGATAPGLSLRAQTLAIMQSCLSELQGDVLAAAARLQVGKSTLYRLLQNGELRLP